VCVCVYLEYIFRLYRVAKFRMAVLQFDKIISNVTTSRFWRLQKCACNESAELRWASNLNKMSHRQQISPSVPPSGELDEIYASSLIPAHSLHYMKTWRKYITCCTTVRGGPSHGHRWHGQKIWWNMDVWFLRHASRQTSRQTDTETLMAIFRTPTGGDRRSNTSWDVYKDMDCKCIMKTKTNRKQMIITYATFLWIIVLLRVGGPLERLFQRRVQ